MAHLSDGVLLQQEASAGPTPGVWHVATLEYLVNTFQKGSREIRCHLGLVSGEGGVRECSVRAAKYFVGYPIVPRDSTAGWSACICRHCSHTRDGTGQGARAATA
eukprot:924127-Rhodomonas_salina.1